MVEDDPSSARFIAEHLSCLINGVTRVLYPDRFGAVSKYDLAELRRICAQLNESLESFTGRASQECNLARLRTALPVLERTLAPHHGVERRTAAREFLMLAVGPEIVDRLTTGSEAAALQGQAISWLLPWQPVRSGDARQLADELRRELHPAHVLHGRVAWAVGRRIDCDDVLYVLDDPYGLAVVHLTYAAEVPEAPPFPTTRLYRTIDSFSDERMRQDHDAYEGITKG